ncbi:MAG: hypothetical protein RL367_1311, partial [Pseudomonadota bacterium]
MAVPTAIINSNLQNTDEFRIQKYEQFKRNDILTLMSLLSTKSLNKIDRIIEIATGQASATAIAISKLSRKISYTSLDIDYGNCCRLEKFTNLIKIRSQIINDVFDPHMEMMKRSCIIFDHSIDDIYINKYGK